MSSMTSACDMWTARVTFAVERLNSTMMELAEHSRPTSTASVDSVMTSLRDLRNELLSALQLHRHAHTTEPPTCGETRLKPISKDTLEAIEASALLLAQSMKILASQEWAPATEPSPKATEFKQEEEQDNNEDPTWTASNACGCYGCDVYNRSRGLREQGEPEWTDESGDA